MNLKSQLFVLGILTIFISTGNNAFANGFSNYRAEKAKPTTINQNYNSVSSECPYLENERWTACPYLNSLINKNNSDCPYLNGEISCPYLKGLIESNECPYLNKKENAEKGFKVIENKSS